MTTQTKDQTIDETVKVTVNDSTLTHINIANTLANTVKRLKITNNIEYSNSGQFLKNIKAVSKEIDDSRKDITRPLDDIKKRIMTFFKGPLAELSDAEAVLKKAILEYQQEQDRIRYEAEKKAIAQAKSKEDKKRKNLEERARKEKEKGNTAKAEMLTEKAEDIYVPTVVKAPAFEKVEGISTKKVWKAKISDFSMVPQNIYINDEKVQSAIQAIVNKLARATKGAMPISGIDFYQEESIAAGAALINQISETPTND